MEYPKIHERLIAAEGIAYDAGKVALKFFEERLQLHVESKGLQDFVTEADRTVERTIQEYFQNRFPTDAFLGEESGGTAAPAVWVVDPIDGTTNFIKGIPFFCISLAFVCDNSIKIGVIYDPIADKLYSASADGGAYCNDEPIQCSDCDDLTQAVIGLGYSAETEPFAHLGTIERLLGAGGDYRRGGSAALSLAQAAAGNLDGFFEKKLNSWDALAGVIINREAGAYVSPFMENNGLTEGNHCLVCSPALQKKLEKIVLV